MDESFENVTQNNVVLNHQDIPIYEPIIVTPLLENVCSFNNNEPRLMISQIVNENFKSYAGTKVLGPFHKNFNAIIGPNGSGKSNVIDSMLFVFGFRASKIRSKNISVLIHNSDNIQNIQSCTVSVHFQKILDEGPDSYKIVDGTKFVVSRTAYRDNSSFYRFNDKKLTYNEVGAVLRTNGIDLDHNRFLILQGEVEQIAMMKPKAPSENEDGMLEFLEDIIGSNRFKSPLEMLKKREDELSEMRTEQLNRVKAIEKEKDNLEGPKKEAIQYLELENDVIKNKNRIFQRHIYDSKLKEKEATKVKDEIHNELKNFETRYNEIVDQKKTKLIVNKKTIKQYDELTREDEAKCEKFQKLEELDVKCRENLKHIQELIRKNNKMLEVENKKLEELNQIPDIQQKLVDSYTKQLDKLQKSKEKEEESLSTIMDSFKAETADLQKVKVKKEVEVLSMQKTVNAAQSLYNESQLNLDLFKNNLIKETARLEDLRNNIKRIGDTLNEKKKTSEDLVKRIPEATIAHEKANKDLNEINQNEHHKMEQTRQVRAKLEDARSHMQTSHSQSRVVDFIINLKKSNQVKGIYGRLGDLGAIDKKYDVAISTASGALDYIVVETMDVAQSCVKLLKQNNVGLATFIGLDKQLKFQQYCNRKIKTPENAPRLFDLIKVNDDVVLPAFYFALRDTLVAKDLDQATRIAYGAQRFRVVTLEGQLIDTSGTMSGGGNRVTSGKMGSSLQTEIDPKLIEQWERELEQNMGESNAHRENRYKLEEMVERLSKNKQDMAHQLKMIEREIKSLEDQLVQINRQEKEQIVKVKNATPEDAKLKDLERANNLLKKNYDDINKIFTKLLDEIKDINKQIMDIGGDEMKTIKTRITLLDSHIDQVSANLTKAKVAIKTADRNLQKSLEKVDSLTKDLANQTNDLDTFKKETRELEAIATTLLEEKEKIKILIDQVGMELREVTNLLKDLEEEETKKKKVQNATLR